MKNKINIKYSIVSRGTERYNNSGYMAVSTIVKNNIHILNINHGITNSTLDNSYLKCKAKYSIENISFSRFQLITALMYQKHAKEITDNILILGLGNIGITCLFYLLDKKYKNITLYVKELKPYMNNLENVIMKNYNIQIKFVTQLQNLSLYKTFIETTGNTDILKKIFNDVDCNKKIIIISTPRDDSYLISPLTINRKNLVVIGGHELNGIDKIYKNKTFKKLLRNNNNKKYIKNFINIYDYSIKKLKDIKKQKNNFIEIFRY